VTVIVTKKPGGVSQLFNPDTGKVTYKNKSESAMLPITAFGGIVKFNKKGAMATVSGEVTELDSCNVIKESDPAFKDALVNVIEAHKEFAKIQNKAQLNEIKLLEEKLSKI